MATKLDVHPPRPDLQAGGAACTTKLTTVYRFARLLAGDEIGLARVHSISDKGIELSSIINLQIGQEIQLDLSETSSMTATVSEKDGSRYILAFQQSINCAELLRQLVAEARSSCGRPLRLPTPLIPATGHSLNGTHHLKIEDISQRGIKVRHDGSFQPGLRVRIQLPNGLECQGIVRWTTQLSAGLLLADILSADDLGAVSGLGGGPAQLVD